MTRPASLVAAMLGAIWLSQPVLGADDETYRAQASAEYRRIVEALAVRGKLDDDAPEAQRARKVAARLIAVAPTLRPESGAWPWEIHATSDPAVAASCIAGGKILVGSAFVKRLELDDAQLAMLIAHEAAHALADHRRRASVAGIDADPSAELRESEIARFQEDEADRLGLALAHRAGWPLAALLAFFDKLAASEGAGSLSTTHASARARAEAARDYAAALAREDLK